MPQDEFALGAHVAFLRRVVGAQPVPEAQHPLHLGRARAEDVHVDVGVRPPEQAVLEPVPRTERRVRRVGPGTRRQCACGRRP
jgi:hypothetical protein